MASRSPRPRPSALPSIDKEVWLSWVRDADVLLVNGGDALYLCHWMRESGLAELLPSLRDTVYVGLSAGSTDSPEQTMAEAERWAADIKGPAYATDAQTAIKVTDGGGVEVVSEGNWKLFNG